MDVSMYLAVAALLAVVYGFGGLIWTLGGFLLLCTVIARFPLFFAVQTEE
jgi:hypothetical protein